MVMAVMLLPYYHAPQSRKSQVIYREYKNVAKMAEP